MMPASSRGRRGSGGSVCRAIMVALFALFALLVSTANALSATGSRVLVVVSSMSDLKQYSTLTKDLQQRGFQLSYRKVDDAKPALVSYEERQFDHIVFLADDAQKPASDLDSQSLVNFNSQGGNILFAYSPSRADWLRDLAREYSLELTSKSQRLLDHFRFTRKLDDGSHATFTTEGGLSSDNVVFTDQTLSLAQTNPLLIGNAAPHVVGDNPLAFPILTPPSTSITTDGVLGSEPNMAIASVFQLKQSSARVAFVGSKDALSDRLIDNKGGDDSTNMLFMRDLTSWTFQSHGVLKVEGRSHYRVRNSPKDVREIYEEPLEGGSSSMYRINDIVRYSVDIAQHDPELGWIPATRDLNLQVSLIMLDPFITAKLSPQEVDDPDSTSASRRPPSDLDLSLAPLQSNSTTRYTTTFQLPDRLGVYTFRTHWSRLGWTFIDVKDVAPVRPFNHDEEQRFLPASWPYAAASFSTVVGFLVFVVLWLCGEDKEEDKKLKTQ